MLVVLGGGILLGEIFAPQYSSWLANKGFRNDPGNARALRLADPHLLPAQLFFFIGSVMGSRLQVRKIFIYQAFTPARSTTPESFSARCCFTANSASPRSPMACLPA